MGLFPHAPLPAVRPFVWFIRGVLLVPLVFLTGCLTPQQQSDWEWQQYNPHYQPVHRSDRERGYSW